MDFKEFNRLYRKDTISFLIALNLYLGYGSTVLRAGSREDLSGAAALEISSLFAEEKRDHIIETARKLAEMGRRTQCPPPRSPASDGFGLERAGDGQAAVYHQMPGG